MLEIELDLRKYCIETATKRLNNRLLSDYFKSKGGDAQSEEKLALLEKALSCFDFSALRSRYKDLAGNSPARITLTDNGDRPLGITIDGRPIDTEPCIKK